MTETEIRFALTPPLARRLRNHYFNPENAAPKNPGTEHNETVYFDTPDHLLHRHGAEFRVRQNGNGFKQTVKYRLEGATLFSRAEAEINLPTADPDLGHLRDSIPAALAAQLGDAPLAPVFHTSVDRMKTAFAHGGSTIELAYDKGQIQAGKAALALHEVELELKQGSDADLATAALEFVGKVPCSLLIQGKAPRGFHLAIGTEPQPVFASNQEIPAGTTIPDAIATMLRAALAQALANQPSLLETSAPEAVHQMRIGLRRLTSIISAFRPALNLAEAEPLIHETKAFFAQLGDMRDADVFLNETIGLFRPDLMGDARRTILQHAVTGFREQARERVGSYIAGPAFAKLALGWLQWIEAGGWLRNEQPLDRLLLTRPVSEFASRRLRKMNRKLMTRGDHAMTGGVDDWHEARIAAKKLRYAGGPLQAAISTDKSGKHRRNISKRLAKLQDGLGEFNDLCNVGPFLARVSATVPSPSLPAFELAAAFCDGWCQAQVMQAIPRLEKRWARFKAATEEPS